MPRKLAKTVNSSVESEDGRAFVRQIASALSHDIRAPLRHTGHFLDFFERTLSEPVSAEAQEHMRFARGSLDELSEMVELLVDYIRLEEYHQHADGLNLTDIISESMDRSKIAQDAEAASISVLGQAGLAGDEGQLRSLFMHMFDNAIMYCPADRAPQLVVTISSAEQEPITVLVEDNGAGISASEDAIFRMFQNGVKLSTGQGPGVGLPFARRIARLHQGDLHLLPEPSSLGGAAFRLTLGTGNAEPSRD